MLGATPLVKCSAMSLDSTEMCRPFFIDAVACQGKAALAVEVTVGRLPLKCFDSDKTAEAPNGEKLCALSKEAA